MTWKPGDYDRRQERPHDNGLIDRRVHDIEERLDWQFKALSEKLEAVRISPPVALPPTALKTNTWATIGTAAISGLALVVVAYIGAKQLPDIQRNTDGRLSEMIGELGKVREDNKDLRKLVEHLGGPRDPLKEGG